MCVCIAAICCLPFVRWVDEGLACCCCRETSHGGKKKRRTPKYIYKRPLYALLRGWHVFFCLCFGGLRWWPTHPYPPHKSPPLWPPFCELDIQGLDTAAKPRGRAALELGMDVDRGLQGLHARDKAHPKTLLLNTQTSSFLLSVALPWVPASFPLIT